MKIKDLNDILTKLVEDGFGDNEVDLKDIEENQNKKIYLEEGTFCKDSKDFFKTMKVKRQLRISSILKNKE